MTACCCEVLTWCTRLESLTPSLRQMHGILSYEEQIAFAEEQKKKDAAYQKEVARRRLAREATQPKGMRPDDAAPRRRY